MFIIKKAKPHKMFSGLYYNRRKHKYGFVMEGKFVTWFPDYQTGLTFVKDLIYKWMAERKIHPWDTGWWLQNLVDMEAFTERQETIAFQNIMWKNRQLEFYLK